MFFILVGGFALLLSRAYHHINALCLSNGGTMNTEVRRTRSSWDALLGSRVTSRMSFRRSLGVIFARLATPGPHVDSGAMTLTVMLLDSQSLRGRFGTIFWLIYFNSLFNNCVSQIFLGFLWLWMSFFLSLSGLVLKLWGCLKILLLKLGRAEGSCWGVAVCHQ